MAGRPVWPGEQGGPRGVVAGSGAGTLDGTPCVGMQADGGESRYDKLHSSFLSSASLFQADLSYSFRTEIMRKGMMPHSREKSFRIREILFELQLHYFLSSLGNLFFCYIICEMTARPGSAVGRLD